MEDIILKILQGDIGILQVVSLLLVLLLFLIKNRKINEKIDLISNNHLHELSDKLDDIKNEVKSGFNKIDDKLTKVAEDITVIKDRQKRK
jgi:hypothetical protein